MENQLPQIGSSDDRRQFSLRGILIAVAVIGVVLGALAAIGPFFGRRYICRRVDACDNNLRQIGIALRVYAEKQGSFPPAYVADARGKPLYSWRAALLSEVGRTDLATAWRANEAWDGPHNKRLSEQSMLVYHCPSDYTGIEAIDYFAVVGPNTAWPGATGRKLSEIKNPEKTILLIESAASGINWAEPRDVRINELVPVVNRPACFGGHGICSHHVEGGANVLFADGHVEFLPNDTDPQKILSMLDVRNP